MSGTNVSTMLPKWKQNWLDISERCCNMPEAVEEPCVDSGQPCKTSAMFYYWL